jgi:hypothetical protein
VAAVGGLSQTTTVLRQTLSGSDYDLLEDRTFEPRADYLASLLSKRTMGERVLAAASQGNVLVRSYAHCSASQAHEPAGSVGSCC